MMRPARSIATRSHTASTSLRMCDDSSTVCPRSRASRTHSRNTCSMIGSRPVVGSSSRSRSARLANAATSSTFWRLPWLYARTFLSGVEREPLDELGAVRVVDRAVDRAEEPQRLRAGQRRPEVRLARHVREPPVDRGRVVPRVEIEDASRGPRWRGSGRAGARSSSTSRRRSGRGSRRPRRLRSRGRARRARRSARSASTGARSARPRPRDGSPRRVDARTPHVAACRPGSVWRPSSRVEPGVRATGRPAVRRRVRAAS